MPRNRGGRDERRRELSVVLGGRFQASVEELRGNASFSWIWSYGFPLKENGRLVQLKREKANDFFSLLLSSKLRLEDLREKLSEIEERAGKLGYEVVKLQAKTATRLIIGLGSAHFLETGLMIDRLSGLPYIPGSTLKGATRAMMEEEAPDLSELLLGSEERAGVVTFLDSYPKLREGATPRDVYELDIMNPHYSDYYSNEGEQVPGDWLEPKPLKFLAVKPEVTFLFTVLIDRMRCERVEEAKRLIISGLSRALTEGGIGGKKALGYGIFKEVREVS